MALFATQLQPWEEQTSPSPTEEVENPYELALARSRSSSKSGHSHGHGNAHGQINRQNSSGSGRNDSKPPSPINTLHRQLSGDPDAPPPAWKRRASVNNGNGPPSASRRHPGLQMTLSANNRQPLPDQQPLYESSPDPNGGADLSELGLPQPAFRRRSNASSGHSSNRSSTHSLNGLTSEELWQLDHPDLSNPTRQSRERPLDTVRRMSRTFEQPQPWQQQGFPGEVIWPAAMPGDNAPAPPVLKSKSTTSVPGAGGQKQKRLTIRKKTSRQQSLDNPATNDVYLHGAISPNSLSRPDSMILSSSAQSSTTSLNSQGNFSPVKVVTSNVSLNNRPPSTYYSRDFLSSLAPREGGYAIAATMGNGLGAHGAMSVDERRRSQYDPSIRRAPMAKSAGMGRWSLDGGEHYGSRPYGTASAATTASNLSGPPITSPETSPPLEDARLPEGAAASPSASAPAMTRQPDSASADSISPTNTGAGAAMTIPVNPSPLSQQTHANDVATPRSERAPPIPAPVPVTAAVAASSPLNTKKSKKDLAKEAKQDAQRQKIEEHKRKAEAKAAAAKAKADKKEAEQKAKAEVKRKEKEVKEKRKAEKRAGTGRSSSFASLPIGAIKKETPPPVPAVPASATASGSPVPFPRTTSTPSAPKTTAQPRAAAVSMPLDTAKPAPRPTPAPALKEKTSRMSLFGTLKKRFSSGPSSSQPDVRMRQASEAANVGSMPKPAQSQAQAQAQAQADAASPHVATPAAVATSPTRPHVTAPSPPPGGADAVPIQTHSALGPALAPVARVASPQASVKSGRSNSVRGPRPMPISNSNTSPERERAQSQSRPTSLITTPSTEAAPVTPAAGFPFQPKATAPGTMMNPEIVTPSTSTESSMFSNHTAEHSSPFTSVGSRKSSLTTDDAKPLPATEVPERGYSATSKSSEETLQPRPTPAPAPVGLIV